MNRSLINVTFVTLFSFLFLVGCGGVTQSQNVKPAEHKGGFLGLSKADAITLQGEKAIKGETNVVIPRFRIAFYTENNPGGYSSRSGSKVVIHSTLSNVDAQLLQNITDKAYETFVSQLSAKGFNVLPKEQLNQSPTYNKFALTQTQTKEEALFGPDAIYVSPSGMKTSDATISKGFEIQGLLKDFQASFIEVTLYVSYLAQQTKETMMVVTGLEVGQVPTVVPGSMLQFYGYEASKCVGYCPDTVAHVRLGQPIFTQDSMGELKEVTSTTDKLGDTISMVGSWMTSGLKIKNTKRYELVANPPMYEKAMLNVLSKTTSSMVETLSMHK